MRNQSKIIRFLQSKGVIYDNLTSHTKEKIGQMTDNPVVGNILGILEGGKKSGKQASDYKKIISLFENEIHKFLSKMKGGKTVLPSRYFKGGATGLPTIYYGNSMCEYSGYNPSTSSNYTITSDANPSISRGGLDSNFVFDGGKSSQVNDPIVFANYKYVEDLFKGYENKHEVKLRMSKKDKHAMLKNIDNIYKDIITGSVSMKKNGDYTLNKHSLRNSLIDVVKKLL